MCFNCQTGQSLKIRRLTGCRRVRCYCSEHVQAGHKIDTWSESDQFGGGVPDIYGGYNFSRRVVLDISRIRAALDLLLLTLARTFLI